MLAAMVEQRRTEQTYRYELWRAVAAGIVETAGTTFLLLIAVRWYAAGATAKALVAAGGSIGLLLSPVVVSVTTAGGYRVSRAAAAIDLCCLEAATGKAVWQKNLVRDYGAKVPQYGFASQPLVDGERLIVMVGGTNQAVVAFDRQTGQELWKALDATEPGYSAPLIQTLAGQRQLIDQAAGELGAQGAGFGPRPSARRRRFCPALWLAQGLRATFDRDTPDAHSTGGVQPAD